jgi:glycosyltransferase involved in cell wall biosynthesis
MIWLNVTVPVFNEEVCLARNVRHLAHFLEHTVNESFEVVIAENGSNDHSLDIAHQVAAELSCVRVVHLPQPGRGRALKRAWSSSDAQVLSYMDADLSSDITALAAMLNSVAEEEVDIAVGTRLLRPRWTQRSLKRELISRAYAQLVSTLFRTRFSDPQCGFKVLSREVAVSLVPMIRDTGWFFDTELLVLAERLGYRILDVPVAWHEREDSRVQILPTVFADIRGLCRLHSQLKKTTSHGRAAVSNQLN